MISSTISLSYRRVTLILRTCVTCASRGKNKQWKDRAHSVYVNTVITSEVNCQGCWLCMTTIHDGLTRWRDHWWTVYTWTCCAPVRPVQHSIHVQRTIRLWFISDATNNGREYFGRKVSLVSLIQSFFFWFFSLHTSNFHFYHAAHVGSAGVL